MIVFLCLQYKYVLCVQKNRLIKTVHFNPTKHACVPGALFSLGIFPDIRFNIITIQKYDGQSQNGSTCLLCLSFMFFSVLCLLCLCARLFICALWSPAGKGLTSWLSFVMSNCEFVTIPLVSWVRCGT